VCTALLVACDHADQRHKQSLPPPKPELFGPGPRYRPPPFGDAVAHARAVGRFGCSRATPRRFLVHVETFVNGRVVLMPAGIGIAPPQVRRGAFVVRGRCEYPLRTREPTGLVEVAAGTRATLGDLFAIWGKPLSRRRVLSFRGPVAAYLGSRRWGGDPRDIPLRPHAVVTLEIGRYVRPHAEYAFPPGPPTVRP
jgi:hypothetical protein